VRRLLALLIVAVVGAGVYGWSGTSSGLRVNGTDVAASTLRAELTAITASPALQCYLTALASTSFATGAGGDTFGASGAAAWTSLRAEGLAIEQYVATHFRYQSTSYGLRVALSSLQAEMTQAAASKSYTCPGSSAQALGAMTAEMRNAQVRAQAASLFLVSQLNTTIPLNAASLRAYYSAHLAAYDTLCVSVAVVLPSQVAAFKAAQASGSTLALLVHTYSQDPATKAKNGALSCYKPSQSVYSVVRRDVGTAALGQFSTSPSTITSNGSSYALFVAPTSRTVTPFVTASPQVYADAQSLNAASAGVIKENILYRAAVGVDPAFGRWGLSASGPGVFTNAKPPSADVEGASVLAGTTGAIYK
jgi:hypothetical protein